MWTKVDSGDPSLYGENSGVLTWSDALQLAESCDYAGHNDWRLPNAKEWQSIVDYSRSPTATGSAAIDPIFEITPVTNPAGEKDWAEFWTSTSFEPGADAVVVYFGRAMGYFGSERAAPAFIDCTAQAPNAPVPRPVRTAMGSAHRVMSAMSPTLSGLCATPASTFESGLFARLARPVSPAGGGRCLNAWQTRNTRAKCAAGRSCSASGYL